MADDKFIPNVDTLLDRKKFEEAIEQLRSGIRQALEQTVALLKTGLDDSDNVFRESVMEIETARLDKLSSTFRSAVDRLNQSYLYDVTNLQIKEDKAREKQNGFLSEDQTRYYNNKRKQLQREYHSDILALERRQAKAVGEIQEGVNALFSAGTDRRIDKAQKYYAEIVRWADAAAQYQIITQEQATDLIGKTLTGESLQKMRREKKELQRYLDQRKQLLEQAAKEEARLTAQGKTARAEQVGKKLQTDLHELDANYGKQYDLAGMAASGLGNFGAAQVREALARARTQLAEWRLELETLRAQQKEQEAAAQTQEEIARAREQEHAAKQGKSSTAPRTAASKQKKADTTQSVTNDDLKAKESAIQSLESKITAAEKNIKERNPFVALADGIEKYKQAKATGAPVGQDVKDIASAAAGSIGEVKGLFDATLSGMSALGLEMSAETEQILGDVGKLMESAGSVATGIATGNPVQIITGSVGMLTSLFSLFDGKSRRAERRIQKLQAEINALDKQYTKRQEEIGETYDFSIYDKMDEQQENLKEQEAKIRQQIAEEQSKKKTDDAKIAQWNEQIEKLQEQQADIEKQRLEMLAGTTASAAIDQFADALVDAYDDADKAAQRLQETTRSILSNAVKDSLKKQFLAKGIEEAVAYLGQSMKDGELTLAEENAFKQQVEKASEEYRNALKQYERLFPTETAEEEEKPAEGMRGEISEKITEQTASRLEGLFRLGVDLQTRLASLGSEQLVAAQSSLVEVADIARTNIAIEENTRRTADNTDGLRERLDTVAAELRAIKNNTENKQVWAQ